ncbi:YWFCY domain-containing protein [Niabella terrae]
MSTNEHEAALRNIINMTRWISVALLVLHLYDSCYIFYQAQGWRLSATDRLLAQLHRTGLFRNFHLAKILALVFLLLSVLGVKARKGPDYNYRTSISLTASGLLLYFASAALLLLPLDYRQLSLLYTGGTLSGYLLVMSGITILFRMIKDRLSGDLFNKDNETFPQEERLLTNPYSINLPTRYRLRDQIRKGWINIINAFRGGILLMGLPGSGKTLIAKEILRQQIARGYGLFIHDFKYPDLTLVAYNEMRRYRDRFKGQVEFHVINFEEMGERANPLAPDTLHSITDAAAAARSILLGLNQDWMRRQGDFWVESSINFTTALIWYLRLYQDGRYCSLPHVIELAQTSLDKLFTLLAAEPSLEVLVMPFVRAYEQDAARQLIGQISGAAISLGTLASAHLYYVLSGNEFDLRINDTGRPKIICIANNPRVAHIYSPVISLYLNTLQQLLQPQQEQPCGILLEEFASISWHNADKFLSVCRSFLVNVTLIIQDASQLILHYGEKQARVILSMAGNIISGQVTGDAARQLSERFGKILQERRSLTVNSSDSSVSTSRQLEYAIPQSAIASLSAGEVVGVVADNPDQPIERKMFHGQLLHDFKKIKAREAAYQPLPVREVDRRKIQETFLQIKTEVRQLVDEQLQLILQTPGARIIGQAADRSRVPETGIGPDQE